MRGFLRPNGGLNTNWDCSIGVTQLNHSDVQDSELSLPTMQATEHTQGMSHRTTPPSNSNELSTLRSRSQGNDVDVQSLAVDLEARRTPKLMGTQLHQEREGCWMPEKL